MRRNVENERSADAVDAGSIKQSCSKVKTSGMRCSSPWPIDCNASTAAVDPSRHTHLVNWIELDVVQAVV
jgi:hypothetical protein